MSFKQVTFLNKTVNISSPYIWNSKEQEKLWLYNLHYFDDLNSIGASKRESEHYHLINRWINENSFAYGNGWEPYTISLRLVNWIKWFSKKKEVKSYHLKSIGQQAFALLQQIEYHIMGNHIFANAKALVFVGSFLTGELADKSLRAGIRLVNSELDEQFLEDGAHFELSPMYHSILLWDLLELINLAKITRLDALTNNIPFWTRKAEKALNWLSSMVHPDKQISFFNDAAIDIAPAPELVFLFASKLGINHEKNLERVTVNKDSGYTTIKTNTYKLFFDHANIGPDYLPGHAHADTLSFELSAGIERIFVNSGTSLYGVSQERLRQRKTSAHNTIEVQGEDSSEVWSGFRVARRAYAKLEKIYSSNGKIQIIASHNGYYRLKGKNVKHTRELVCEDTSLVINDTLNDGVEARFNLHFHPSIKVKKVNENSLTLVAINGLEINLSCDGIIKLEKSTWHPRFGQSIENQKMVVHFSNGTLTTNIIFLEKRF